MEMLRLSVFFFFFPTQQILHVGIQKLFSPHSLPLAICGSYCCFYLCLLFTLVF